MAERALDLSELTLASMNEVIAGRVVNFTSTSTGEPTTMRWTITRQGGTSVELTGASVSNKFSVPGTYDVTLKASSQFGSSSVTLKDYIKIIPSTDPVTLDEVNRDAEDVIGLVFSRAIQTPTEINKTALTVSITNGGAPVSAQILSVTKVDNIVKIKLNTKIYSSDIIKVSYDDTKGDLITEDAVNVKSFTDVQLMNFKVANLLTGSAFDSGFEI
jgi:PKD repeat protein